MVIAHKFGENSFRPVRELHESGIVYCGNTNYLITVMNKGSDINALADFMATVSQKVYTHFAAVN